MRGMSDWSLHELANIAWDEFGNSDDHIVPHQGVKQVNENATPGKALKKPRHDVEDVGNSTDGRGSATKTALWWKEETYFHSPMKDRSSTILEGSRSHESENVVPAPCDPEFISSTSALASQGARSYNECVNDFNTDTENDNFCSKVPTLSIAVSADGSRSCHLSLDDVTLAVTNPDLLENENEERENDLLYYDLPDIDNFDEPDRMFRNWDATFGPDELSWFSSSSNTVYGSEVTLEPGLQSSCSPLSALNNKFGHHDADTNLLPKRDQPTANHDKSSSFCYESFVDWLDIDTEYKGGSALSEQINMHLKNMESQSLSEEKRKQRHADQKLLSSVISTRSNQDSLKQKHFLEAAASSHVQSFNPHPKLEQGGPMHQVPFPHATSIIKFENGITLSSLNKSPGSVTNRDPHCMEKLLDQMCRSSTLTSKTKLENLHDRRQFCTPMNAEHMHHQAYFTTRALLQKKHCERRHEIRANSEVKNISLEPADEKDSSIVEERTCMTSARPDGVSLEATSFRQLGDVMDQLDIRTKLCIRDSLYRLAKSAWVF